MTSPASDLEAQTELRGAARALLTARQLDVLNALDEQDETYSSMAGQASTLVARLAGGDPNRANVLLATLVAAMCDLHAASMATIATEYGIDVNDAWRRMLVSIERSEQPSG